MMGHSQNSKWSELRQLFIDLDTGPQVKRGRLQHCPKHAYIRTIRNIRYERTFFKKTNGQHEYRRRTNELKVYGIIRHEDIGTQRHLVRVYVRIYCMLVAVVGPSVIIIILTLESELNCQMSEVPAQL